MLMKLHHGESCLFRLHQQNQTTENLALLLRHLHHKKKMKETEEYYFLNYEKMKETEKTHYRNSRKMILMKKVLSCRRLTARHRVNTERS